MILEEEKKKSKYPVLIVDHLPESFGNIEKNDKVSTENISQNEQILLTLIAKIMVEITLNEEL